MSYPLEFLFLSGAFILGLAIGACISVSKAAKPPQWDKRHEVRRDSLDRWLGK